jgi:hypothetical protein
MKAGSYFIALSILAAFALTACPGTEYDKTTHKSYKEVVAKRIQDNGKWYNHYVTTFDKSKGAEVDVLATRSYDGQKFYPDEISIRNVVFSDTPDDLIAQGKTPIYDDRSYIRIIVEYNDDGQAPQFLQLSNKDVRTSPPSDGNDHGRIWADRNSSTGVYSITLVNLPKNTRAVHFKIQREKELRAVTDSTFKIAAE